VVASQRPHARPAHGDGEREGVVVPGPGLVFFCLAGCRTPGLGPPPVRNSVAYGRNGTRRTLLPSLTRSIINRAHFRCVSPFLLNPRHVPYLSTFVFFSFLNDLSPPPVVRRCNKVLTVCFKYCCVLIRLRDRDPVTVDNQFLYVTEYFF
jgi:hypothetical protein